MFSLICVWINGWVNNREAGDLRRHRAHYDVNVMNVYDGHIVMLANIFVRIDVNRTNYIVISQLIDVIVIRCPFCMVW